MKKDDGSEEYHIGTNRSGDVHFKDMFGMWVTALASRLNWYRNRSNKFNKKSLSKAIEEPREFLMSINPDIKPDDYYVTDKPEEEIPATKEPEDKEPINTDKKVDEPTSGIIHIDDNTFNNMKNYWHPKKDEFKGMFTRSKVINDIGVGFKYSFKDRTDGEIYLLQSKELTDDESFIIFTNKEVYDLAKRIGLLDFWIGVDNPKPIHKHPVKWK